MINRKNISQRVSHIFSVILWLIAITLWIFTLVAWFVSGSDLTQLVDKLPFLRNNLQWLQNFLGDWELNYEPLNAATGAIVSTLSAAIASRGLNNRKGNQQYSTTSSYILDVEQQLQYRKNMLGLVNTIWINGVLHHSMHDAIMMEIGIKEKIDAIEPLWEVKLYSNSEKLNKSYVTTQVVEVFDQTNGLLLILGEPGSGKTTTLLQLTDVLIRRAKGDPQHPIPVIFNLSSWINEKLPIAEWVILELFSKYDVPKQLGNYWVANSNLLYLFDGLDEVASSHRNECVIAINEFRKAHFVSVVICSRTTEYEALQFKLRLNGAISLLPLTSSQIQEYLSRLEENGLVSIRKAIQTDPHLDELSHSPLMLSIMVLVYKNIPYENLYESATIEISQNQLFADYLRRVLGSSRSNTKFSPNISLYQLKWLAQQLTKREQSIFLIENLQPDWLSNKGLKAVYSVIIRLFCVIPIWISTSVATVIALRMMSPDGILGIYAGIVLGFACGMAMLLTRSINYTIYRRLSIGILFGIGFGLAAYDFIESQPLSLLVGLVIGIMSAWVFKRADIDRSKETSGWFETDRITSVEILVWSWQGAEIGFQTRLPYSTIFGMLVGAIITYQYGLSTGIIAFSSATLMFAAASALSGGLLVQELGDKVKPNQGIIRSLEVSFQFSFISGTIVALATGTVVGSATHILNGVVSGAAFFVAGATIGFFSLGGFEAIKHYILRLLLYFDRKIYLRYIRFLDYAADRIILRKVGGGYIFIHRLVRDFLAKDSDLRSL